MATPPGSRTAAKRSRFATLTSRGRVFVVITVIMFVAAYVAGNQIFQLIATLFAALLVISVIFVRVRRLRLSAVRTFNPPIVAAGASTSVALTVTNLSSTRSAEADWQDSLPWWPWSSDEGRLASLAPFGPRFGNRNTVTLRYVVHPPRRGIVDIGPLDVSLVDPFGLVRGDAALWGTQQLIVTPQLTVLPDAGLAFAAGDGHARLVQRSAAGNDDDLMTREYRRGDALRRVHWRASARHGELMVRQEEQRARPEVRLLLDTRRTGYDDVITTPVRGATAELDSATFEWAVTMVASVGVHLHRAGFLVSVIETAEPQLAQLGDANSWAAHDEAFLASLASVSLQDADTSLRQATESATGPLFAVIGEPDDETLEWLLRQRRPQQRAVAFLPAWAKRATETLTNAGWQCVRTRTTDDPAAAWAAISMPGGRS